MIKTKGLYHVHLHVRSLEKSLRFYQAVFGMEKRYAVGDHMVFLSTPGTNDLITLNQVGPQEEVGKSGGVEHFGFALDESESMDRAVALVEEHGGKLIKRGEHAPGHAFCYVADPDGYKIEL